MTNTELLKGFLKDDEILETLIVFKERKMKGCETLKALLFPKWKITTLEAMGILQKVEKEFDGNIVVN